LTEYGEAEHSLRCEQRSDDDGRNCGVTEREPNCGAEQQRKHGSCDAKGDRAVADAVEQRKVDFQADEEHQ
jgi:hypothetical protein